MNYKYKIEEWDTEFGGLVYVAFVGRRWGEGGLVWHEIGRAGSKLSAEMICHNHQRPANGPWYYTADAV